MKQIASFAAVLAVVLMVGFTHTLAAQDTTVVEIKKGEVLRVLNNTVVVRVEGEGVRTYVVPYDFKFNHEGQEITVRELREGQQLTSVRLRTVGAPQDIAEEDVATLTVEDSVEDSDAPADVAEAVTQAAEAVTEAAGETADSMAGDDDSAEDEDPVEEMAEAAETAEAAATDSGGMSPGLMVGLLLLALVLVVLAVKQLRKA